MMPTTGKSHPTPPYARAMSGDELLNQQVAYYRARAPEYDNWWERRAQYALEADVDAQWRDEVAALEELVDRWLEPVDGGTALELACGTGNWTRRLAGQAHEVVAVDTSPEAIEIARRKLPPGAQVRFVEADVFGWEPRVRFDLVFFSFWLSHVPPDRFESFWGLVDRCLSAGGRVVLIDNKWNDGVWPQIAERPRDFVQVRTDLSGGEAHRVVKIYYEPDELASRLAELGWRAEMTSTPRFFIAGLATR